VHNEGAYPRLSGINQLAVIAQGPGGYNLPGQFGSPSPSSRLQGTRSFKIVQDTGGPTPRQDIAAPGHYSPNPDVYLKSSRGYGFGSSKRWMSEASKSELSRPGPDCEHVDNPNFSRPPRYGFGSEARRCPMFGDAGMAPSPKATASLPSPPSPRTEAQRRLLFPGPGQGDPDFQKASRVGKGPSYSMSPRDLPTKDKLLANPGPGSYDRTTDSKVKSTPVCRFGTARRMLVPEESNSANAVKTGVPGPGKYSQRKTSHNESLFSLTEDGSPESGGPKWSMPGRGKFDLAGGFV